MEEEERLSMSVDMDRRRSFPHPGIVLPPIKRGRMGNYCLIAAFYLTKHCLVSHKILPGIIPGTRYHT